MSLKGCNLLQLTYVPWSNDLSELLYEKGLLWTLNSSFKLLFPTINPVWHKELKINVKKEIL